MTGFWRISDDGATLMVKVQPKSRRPGLQGVAPSSDGPRLRIGVTEAAEGGRANQAVCNFIADLLDVPRSSVQVVIGASSREKRLLVQADPATLASRLETL